MKINPVYIDLIEGKIDGAYKFPFYFLCHRIPDRTFKINGHYFPVCARCTGMYTAAFIYFFVAAFIPIMYNMGSIILSVLLITPTAIDGVSQLINERESNNKLRFFTGLLAGLGLAIFSRAIRFIIIY